MCGRDSVLSRCNWQRAFLLSSLGQGHLQRAAPLASSAGANSASGTCTAQLVWSEGRWIACKQHTVNWFQFVLGLQVRAWT